jgi:hypothetical protein
MRGKEQQDLHPSPSYSSHLSSVCSNIIMVFFSRIVVLASIAGLAAASTVPAEISKFPTLFVY